MHVLYVFSSSSLAKISQCFAERAVLEYLPYAARIPVPPEHGEEGEMYVVPVPLALTHALSTLRISLPEDLRPPENRKATMLTVQAKTPHLIQSSRSWSILVLGSFSFSDLKGSSCVLPS